MKKVPSIRRKTTKAGRDYYEITVSRGRSLPRLFSRWYVPEGWSQRAIDRELAKVAAEFERQCKAGEVVSRREKAPAGGPGGGRGGKDPDGAPVWGTCVHACKGPSQ